MPHSPNSPNISGLTASAFLDSIFESQIQDRDFDRRIRETIARIRAGSPTVTVTGVGGGGTSYQPPSNYVTPDVEFTPLYGSSLDTWHTDPYPPTQEKKYPMRQERTLLYIIKKIKEKTKSLLENPNAYTWQWLNHHCYNYLSMYNRVYMVQDEPQKYSTTNIENRYLTILKKATGEEFLRIDGKFQAKKNLKAYWRLGILRHISNEDFVYKKDIGEIRWCAIEQDWCHNDSFKRHYYKNASGEMESKIRSMAKRPKDSCICPMCTTTWEPGYFKEREEVDLTVCPICFDKPLKNEPFLYDFIYGGYHSHKSWVFLPQKDNPKDTAFPMGVELEVQIKDTSRGSNINQEVCWKIYQAQQELESKPHNIYFERDGSLSETSIEIVSNPMTLDYHKKYWEHMLPKIQEHCVGWNVEKYNKGTNKNYGIHLTFHRRYWSDLMLARLTKFLERKDNKDLVWAISQRIVNYGGKDVASSEKAKLKETINVEKGKILYSVSRNQTVHIKQTAPLVEIRMFNSTLNYESFMKNIEFLDAFWNWCKETPFSSKHADFIDWLGSRSHHKYRYENLISYLSRPKFFIKHSTSYNNPFMSLIKGQRGQLDLFGVELKEENVCA